MGGRATTIALASLAALSAIATGAGVHAQTTPLGNVNATRFTPVPGAGNYLQVDGAQVSGHVKPTAGLMFDYAQEPLVLFRAQCTGAGQANCGAQAVQTKLVAYTATFHLHGALTLWDRVQLGLVLPLILADGDGFNDVDSSLPTPGMVSIPGGSAFAVGDPMFNVKVRILGEGNQGLHLGSAVFVTAPLANATAPDRFLGNNSVSVGGHFIAQFVKWGMHLAGNIGARYRSKTTLLSSSQGSGFYYRGAAGYEATNWLLVFAEIDGESGFDKGVEANPLEGQLAVRFSKGDFSATVGGGGGFVGGVGVPTFRVLAGFLWAPDRGDEDHDGVEDGADLCPDQAEDLDGFEDLDGCPEVDNDHDGLFDKADRCPNEAEDLDGVEDEDGCPDVDNDGDGIEDGYDSCPNQAEDKDGDTDDDGCPE